MSSGWREPTTTEHPAIPKGRRLVAVDPGADAYTALTIMRQNEVRHLPVVVDGRCIGLLTESDLLRGLAAPVSATELTVGRLCHRPAPAVPAGSSLPIMAATMIDAGADAAIVVSNGTMVGMVTSSDVLGAVTGKWRSNGGLSTGDQRPAVVRSNDLGSAP